MTIPRRSQAPAATPCLFDPTGADDPGDYSDVAGLPLCAGMVRFRCKNLGLTWIIDAWEDRGRTWIYDLAPESWPVMLRLLREGHVQTQSIAHLAILAQASGRVDLSEDLLREGREAHQPIGDRRSVDALLATIERLPTEALAVGRHIRDMFEADGAGRAEAARWLGRLAPETDPTALSHAGKALVSALADPEPAVAAAAAHGLARHEGNGPHVSRASRLLYAHHRRDRSCDCFVLPRWERPREEVTCMTELTDPDALRLPPHHPHRMVCPASGITWLGGQSAFSPLWSFMPATESWPRVLEMVARGEMTIVGPYLVALQAQGVGRLDIAERLLVEGLGPDGLIGVLGERIGATAMLQRLTRARPRLAGG